MLRKLVVLLVVLFAFPLFAGHRFHASAVAVGGTDLPSVASVSLAPTGGDGASAMRDYDDGVVRFAEATSVVRGSRDGDFAVTSSEVTIRNLVIAGRIRADVVIARINERHAANAPEAEITFEGSSIENLTIDGVPVTAALDHAYFAARPTFDAMSAAGVAASRSGTMLCNARGAASCGAVRDETWGIVIPGLGVLTIGEVFVTRGHRELNMVRLERTPPADTPRRPARIAVNDGGTPKSVVVGSVTGNGTDFGPP
jgi:hypothetical protein